MAEMELLRLIASPTRRACRAACPYLTDIDAAEERRLVELAGFGPATSSMPRKRAPTAPQPHLQLASNYSVARWGCQAYSLSGD